MRKKRKEFCIEIIDSCMDLYLAGIHVTCAMRPYYALIRFAVRERWSDLSYIIWIEDQKFARARAMKWGMHNLKATEPEGITNEVSTG